MPTPAKPAKDLPAVDNKVLYQKAFQLFMSSDLTPDQVAARIPEINGPQLCMYAIRNNWEQIRANTRLARSLAGEDRMEKARAHDAALVDYAGQAIHVVMPAYLELINDIVRGEQANLAHQILGIGEEGDEDIKPEPLSRAGATKKKPRLGPIGKIEALNAATEGLTNFVKGMKEMGLVIAPKDPSVNAGGAGPLPAATINLINVALQRKNTGHPLAGAKDVTPEPEKDQEGD